MFFVTSMMYFLSDLVVWAVIIVLAYYILKSEGRAPTSPFIKVEVGENNKLVGWLVYDYGKIRAYKLSDEEMAKHNVLEALESNRRLVGGKIAEKVHQDFQKRNRNEFDRLLEEARRNKMENNSTVQKEEVQEEQLTLDIQ